MHIHREIQDYLYKYLTNKHPFGFIVSGIVGCGKTTMIEKVADELSHKLKIFSYNGDDTSFRQKVSDNSKFILEDIAQKTSKPSLIFVDEVQKSPEVFDAIKLAFDHGKHSFIVSGSNPAYLGTIAKKRLQRRAEQILLLPISLSEILNHRGLIPKTYEMFNEILFKLESLENFKIPSLDKPDNLSTLVEEYLLYGGLPLSLLADGAEHRLREIRLTVERGFELLNVETSNLADRIRTELADLQSQEFTYKNILEKTRLRRREPINLVINDLLNHGYLVRKKPMLIKNNRDSYLQCFSYIDPGIVTYLSGRRNTDNLGHQLEGYIHARFSYRVWNSVYKSELGYYKPHRVEGEKIRFEPGEIDFIIKHGSRVVPIEVKMTSDVSQIDLSQMKVFLRTHKVPFGVIIYGGAPYLDVSANLLYWPYWML